MWKSMWINFCDRNPCAPRNYVNPCILLGFFVQTKSKYLVNLGMDKQLIILIIVWYLAYCTKRGGGGLWMLVILHNEQTYVAFTIHNRLTNPHPSNSFPLSIIFILTFFSNLLNQHPFTPSMLTSRTSYKIYKLFTFCY